ISVNVNRSMSDQFYRYKMPRLIAKHLIGLLHIPPNILVVSWEHRPSLMLRMTVTSSMDLMRRISCKTCWMDSLKNFVRILKQICMSIQRSKQ
uniref:Uncharacterized protein n=1 Tax=Sus scrofa TaxID=9823 RepID=A0A8W4F7Q1_PIG